MQQNNWVKSLLLAQLVINNRILVTTRQPPFRVNHGIDSNFGQISEKSFQKMINLQETWTNMKTQWSKSQQVIIQKDTKKENLQLKKKNKVYVHIKSFRNKKLNKKLNAKKIGLFLVKQVLLNNINYCFKLLFAQCI